MEPGHAAVGRLAGCQAVRAQNVKSLLSIKIFNFLLCLARYSIASASLMTLFWQTLLKSCFLGCKILQSPMVSC